MKSFILARNDGEQTFARPASDTINAAFMSAGTAEVQAVPSGALFVVFSSDGDFYAKPNTLPSVPVADVTNGGAAEINPTVWSLSSITGIGLVASTTRIVTLSYYGK
jgi:hypothetical protein